MDLSEDLPGNSRGMVALREKVDQLLRHQTRSGLMPTVLIQGETGTGKGRLARVLHRRGPRAAAPFINVSCAAIPTEIAESLLFGARKGIYTGAHESRPGHFQAASGGILFLDEAGLLSEPLQGKLLKAIDEREVWPLGANRPEKVDAWVIAATNEDLTPANPRRHFRRDLYYRLSTFTLVLPPLRERGDDILLLARRFVGQACEDHEKPPKTLAPDAQDALLAYDWPGNVRELENVIERVAAFSEAPQITAEMLALPRVADPRPPTVPRGNTPPRVQEPSEGDERQRILQALIETDWVITRAADLLGWSRNTLRYRMKMHGLRRGDGPTVVPGSAGVPTGTPPRDIDPAVPASAPAEGPAPPLGQPETAPTVIRWERRRVTLLRVALVSPPSSESVAFGSRGPEAFKTIVEKVQSFGGRVEELSQTGVVAAFGLEPIEDAPLHAAHTALAILRAVERAGRGVADGVTIRSVIHVGQFLIGQVGGGVQMDQDAKREAWRALEALEPDAKPNTIIVSDAAEPFLKRRFDLVPLRPGEGSTGLGYRLAGRGAAGGGGRIGEFVGSRQYLTLLHSHLASASSGRGQFVGIVGEAGIGKSRLLLEFRRSLSGTKITDLEGHCLSYGTAVPYLPIVEMLKQNFGITGVHGAAAITDRVQAGLRALGMEPAEWMPFFLQLFGIREETGPLATLSPEAIKARTVEGLRQMMVRGSRLRPLIIVLEDLHWIDRTSEECVAALVEILAGSPILFVATYRPGYSPAWLNRSYSAQIPMQPLSSDDSLTVVWSILGTDQVPESLTRLILDKAEGNPFFLEELSRTVGEHGSLHPTLTVPDTIQEVLLARIRRLPESTKEVLQTASVLGREVPLRLLASIREERSTPLEPHLTALIRLEFLHQATDGAEPVYVFKHALTQEVAYESLAAPRRQALHAAAGTALEQHYAGHPEDAYEQLAHHFARTDQPERAVHYLTRFARKAATLYAHEEAVRALREARAHVRKLPIQDRDRRRLELVLWQASSLFPLGRTQELLDLLLPERGALEHLKDPTLAGEYHFMLGRAYSFLADHQRAAEHAQLAIDEADRYGDDVLKGKAYCLRAQDAPVSGRAAEGIEDGRRAVHLLQRTRERWWLANAHWVVALNHAQIGEFARAFESLEQANAIAEATGDPRQRTLAAWGAGILHAVIGELDQGIEECRRALDRAPDPLNRAIAAGWLGFAHAQKGETDQAIPLLEGSVKLFAQWGYRALQGWFGAFLAEAFRAKGDLERALEYAGRALQIGTDAGIAVVRGWAQHSLGRISQGRNSLTEAADWLDLALETFGSIHSRYEMACTELDLAAVYHAQGRRRQAALHLRQARDIFVALAVPYHVRRTEALAARLAVVLPPAR